MNYRVIHERFALRGVNPPIKLCLDENYLAPTQRWANEVFWTSFRVNLERLGLLQYAGPKWDCDKFSRLAWALASISHALTPGHKEFGYAAKGLFCYNRQPHAPHAIVFDVPGDVHGDSPNSIIYGEPQIQATVKLTEEEERSCFAYVI